MTILAEDYVGIVKNECRTLERDATVLQLVVHVSAWRMEMAKKKPSVSSRPAKLISVSAESIFSKPLSKKQKAVLSRIAKRQAAGDDSDIDYSDIPPLTDEQLAQFRRTPKVLVAALASTGMFTTG